MSDSGPFPTHSAFLELCRSKGWDPYDASTWHDGVYRPIMPSPDPDTPGTHGSESNLNADGINVTDYEISDMEPTQIEVATKARSKGKGKAKATVSEPMGKCGGKKYSLDETINLAKCYIDVSEDAVVANNQGVRTFWTRIADVYNRNKPVWAVPRDWDQLRKHWSRVAADVSKFVGILDNLQRMWPSGHTWDDLVSKACNIFQEEENKEFKYVKVYEVVKDHSKFASGIPPAGPKRTKVGADGSFTSSGGDAFDLNTPVGDSQDTEDTRDSRPPGRNASKRKGKSKASGATSAAPALPDPNVIMAYTKGEMMKTLQSTLRSFRRAESEKEREMHLELIDLLRTTLGLG